MVIVGNTQDSFVHTLANYLRQTGAEVITTRSHPGKVGLDPKDIDRLAKQFGKFSLAVLSPGPGNPTDFQVRVVVRAVVVVAAAAAAALVVVVAVVLLR